MIEVKEITKYYGIGESRFQVLKGISLEIKDGDFTVILGASGSGKSTLLNVISGLEHPDGGRVSYDGADITTLSDQELTAFRKKTVGFIFQQYYLLPNMNVDKNVKMGADLAGNRDYKAVIKAVGLEEKLQAASSSGSASQEPWRKSQRFCFLTNPQAHWMSRQGDHCLLIFVNFRRNMGLPS